MSPGSPPAPIDGARYTRGGDPGCRSQGTGNPSHPASHRCTQYITTAPVFEGIPAAALLVEFVMPGADVRGSGPTGRWSNRHGRKDVTAPGQRPADRNVPGSIIPWATTSRPATLYRIFRPTHAGTAVPALPIDVSGSMLCRACRHGGKTRSSPPDHSDPSGASMLRCMTTALGEMGAFDVDVGG